jgi:tetratricopeptide (TPR) repeat protein
MTFGTTESTAFTPLDLRAPPPEDPLTLSTMNHLAWMLVTRAETTVPEAERALKLSQKTCQLQPRNRACLNTLGVAHYRAGQYQPAIEALQKSIEAGFDTPDNWLFLAMAHWKLDEQEEGCQWFDKALQWRETTQPGDELAGFFAEAGQLHGSLSDAGDATSTESTPAEPASRDGDSSSDDSSRHPQSQSPLPVP